MSVANGEPGPEDLDHRGRRHPGFKEVLSSTGVQVVGRAVALLGGLVSLALTARLLGPDGLAAIAVVLTVHGIALALADFGTQTSTVRLIATGTVHPEQGVAAALHVRLLTSTVAVSISTVALIAAGVDGSPLVPILLGASIFLTSICGIGRIGFQLEAKMAKPVFSEVLGRWVSVAVLVAVFLRDGGVVAVSASYLIGSVAALVVLIVVGGFRTGEYFLRPSFPEMKRTAFQGFPIGINMALSQFYARADLLVIAALLPQSAAGFYAVGLRYVEIGSLIRPLFASTFFPYLTRDIATQGGERAFAQGLRVMLGLGALIALVGVAAGPELATVIGGSEFTDTSGSLIQILGLSVPVVFSAGTFAMDFVARGRFWAPTVILGVALVANIIANVIFVPTYGITASAWIVVVTAGLALLATLWLRRSGSCTPVTDPAKVLVPTLATLAVAGLAAIGRHWIGGLVIPPALAAGAAIWLAAGGLEAIRSFRTSRPAPAPDPDPQAV